MSTYHLVWLKFPPSVPPDRVESHLAALRSLAREVPGIESVACGANFTDRANGFTHGLIVKLRDRKALAEYAAHPYHVRVAAALRADGQLLALDFDD